MSGRARQFVIAAVIVIVVAAVLWPSSREEDEERVDHSTPATVTATDAATPAPVAPQGSRSGDEDWFPDLSDRNDLPGVNLGAEVQRATFDCDIEELLNSQGFDETFDGEGSDELIMNLLDMLAASGDAELQIAAAQLSSEADVGLDGMEERYGELVLLERAYHADPMRPHVLWHVAMACDLSSSEFCRDPQLQANTLTVLGSNGEYWALVAEQRFEEGDDQGALEALRQATAAPEFDNYFLEDLRMLQRTFSMIPDLAYSGQTLAAYALAHSNQGQAQQGIFLACGDIAPTRPDWFDACLSLAGRYETEGRTASEQRAGAGMQARLYEAAGRTEEAAAVRERRRGIRGIVDIIDEDMAAVVLTDDRVLGLFLEELAAGNEVSATLFVRDEVERLKQDPDYHPCPTDEIAE